MRLKTIEAAVEYLKSKKVEYISVHMSSYASEVIVEGAGADDTSYTVQLTPHLVEDQVKIIISRTERSFCGKS